jgi:hypothetical protein
MEAKVTKPFNTAIQRFKPGDTVSIDQVGEALFYACTDAEKPKEAKASKDPDEKKPE